MTYDDITKWMNNNSLFDVLMIDVAKTFDTVAHKRLLEKLQYNCIGRTEQPEHGLTHSSATG